VCVSGLKNVKPDGSRLMPLKALRREFSQVQMSFDFLCKLSSLHGQGRIFQNDEPSPEASSPLVSGLLCVGDGSRLVVELHQKLDRGF